VFWVLQGNYAFDLGSPKNAGLFTIIGIIDASLSGSR
jgi:hypothetical protein